MTQPAKSDSFRFTRWVRFDRVRLLAGCLVGRHEWEKQRGTFGKGKVAPDGHFYEAHYCIWCGTGYPAPSIVRAIWNEVRGA